jgi:streptogramin lyase
MRVQTRREFLGTVAAGMMVRGDYPVHHPSVEILWKSPDGHPNALEACEEGLWVGEQVTDNAYLLDWDTGKVQRKIATQSSNTSGIAYGGGFLWVAANGKSLWRDPKPTDATTGVVIKVDPQTGKTVERYPVPGGGGVHGLLWAENSLWITTLSLKSLTQVDADFKTLRSVPVPLDRAHGLAWDQGSIWCVFTSDYQILRLDAKNGRILEAVHLKKGSDPDPHGMDRYQRAFYYCDAGIGVNGSDNGSKYAGYVCRFQL